MEDGVYAEYHCGVVALNIKLGDLGFVSERIGRLVASLRLVWL